MLGQTGPQSLGFKRDVVLMASQESNLASTISDFKAFAEVNRDLIVRMRHARFYCTLLLKDMLLSGQSYDQIQQFYGLTSGDIQAF
jgi:hypothetical protein